LATLSRNDTRHKQQHTSIECRYADCRDYLNVILTVVIM